ncbi:Transposon Ty3-I Gag-Pol polyprotein [Frankliniella fusca]|uniref:RNA-directed DNA polymerase n=1 Tax=Frankliniella fusca TaxID=407009 RepID=A0AAE1I456_9NEOP|nr:Transposon Ty3-I Gag-Pol polyprotein [Frankliniella fusca]
MEAAETQINWTQVVPDGVSPEQMVKDQRLDPHILPILLAVEERRRPKLDEISGLSNKARSLWHQFNSLCMEENLLYRRHEHPSGQPEKERLQLILPEKYVKNTIKYYHSQMGEGNHFGITKTLGHLSRFFWWPGISTDVSAHIVRCETCLKFKGPLRKNRAPLKIFQDGVLHGRWHVDVCDMPVTTEGYRYLLVAVEAFSGWPVMVPMKNQSAETIARALISDVFSVYGAPISILTDQGRAFDSELFKEIMDLYHIRKLRTSGYHPSANGKAERWIRTLKKNLAMLVGKTLHNWPDYIPFVAQAYRSLPHTSHKFSPYEVMFGAPMRTPSTLSQGIPPEVPQMRRDYPYAVREVLAEIHETVRSMNLQAATKMKSYYDRTAMVQPFVAGDKVLLYRRQRKSGESLKLKALWEGPFVIITIINDCNARIERIDPPKDRMIVHMDRLALYPRTEDSEGAWLNLVLSE